MFEENVKKYLKLDNSIRITMEQLKDLKEKRKPYEEYILKYLEGADAPCINLADGKLIKNKAETLSPLKLEVIKDSIKEGIKNEGKDLANANDVKFNDVTEKIIELMNQKRGKSSRTNLKRTFVRKNNNKNKNNKNDDKNEDNKQ